MGLVAAVFLLFCSHIPVAAAGYAARAARVIDGDTLGLDNGEVLRLAGLDAPEMGRPEEGRAEQFFAREAAALLESLVRDRDLRVESLGRDDYGRTLALVATDGVLVNEALLEQGAAFYLYYPDRPPGLDARLLAAQARAMDAGRGFWPRIVALAAARQPWVGNLKSGRAVPAASREAKRVAARHRVAFASLTEAMRKGYAPARPLSPWPSADVSH